PNPVRAGAFRRVPEIQGLYPKSKPPLLGVVLIEENLPKRDRLILVGYSCLNLKHFVRSKRIYGEGLTKNY
ncbi:MAG: hypothetical protein KH175_03610, partial [Collinsella sp.]|nr:hypothetical protein [Collinsella sp.]